MQNSLKLTFDVMYIFLLGNVMETALDDDDLFIYSFKCSYNFMENIGQNSRMEDYKRIIKTEH